MKIKLGQSRLGLLLAFGLASCLRASAPEVPAHLNATLALSERPTGPHGHEPFGIVAAGPRGEIGNNRSPGITFVFNRSMRSLNEAEEKRTKVPLATLATEQGQVIAGEFRWVGTHGLLFEPEARLPGATRFVATVAAGATALDGSRLSAPYRLEFNTQRTTLVETIPPQGSTQVKPNEPLNLGFSLPVSAEELRSKLVLTREQPGSAKPETIPFEVQSGSGPRSELSWLKVVPHAALGVDTTYSAAITTGLHTTAGPLATDKPITWTFKTYGPLRLENVVCGRQDLGRCEAHRDFTVTLSNPVATEEFQRHLVIKGPKRPARPSSSTADSDSADSNDKAKSERGPRTKGKRPKRNLPDVKQALNLDPDYGDHFRITLTAGMTDTLGQKLERDVSVDVAVEDPFVLPKGGKQAPTKKTSAPQSNDTENEYNGYDYGYNGYTTTEPPLDVPRREKLVHNLELGVAGEVLEALAGVDGRDGPARHQIPIGSVNLPSYGVRAWSSSELSTARWLGAQQGGPGEISQEPGWTWLTPGGPANQRAVHVFDLDQTLGGAPSHGVAFIQALGLGEPSYQSQLLSVTDLGISGHISRFGSSVWITRLSTGKPQPGASVVLYDKSSAVLATKTCDEQGLVDFSADELKPVTKQGDLDGSLLLVARSGNDWTFQRVQRSYGISTGRWIDHAQKPSWAGLVFADRGVYRPGENVRVGGYVRRTKESGFDVPRGHEFEYLVNDANGETIAQGRGELDVFGALALDIPLVKSAALGTASLTVRLGRAYEDTLTSTFDILDYKPAEFKVNVEPEQPQTVNGSTIGFRIHSEYLFGAPVAGGNLSQYVSETDVDFAPPGSDDYVVDDRAYKSDLRYSEVAAPDYSEYSNELDEQGTFERKLDLSGPSPLVPRRLVLEAEVQDLSQQAQTGRNSILIHPAQFYLGLKPVTRRFLAVGAEVIPDVVAFDPSGKHLAGVSAHVELFRRTWLSAVEDRPADSLYYNTLVHDERVADCNINAGGKASACHLRLDAAGYYIVRVSSKDALGNPAFASTALYALDDRADSQPDNVAWKHGDRKTMSLELDRASYTPGDTAKLLVKNPFKAGAALVTVERGGILQRWVTELKGAMPVIDIPVKDDMFPNAFVSVHLLRGRTAPAVALETAYLADVGAPQFRVGYTELRVDPEARRLNVAVKTTKPSYGPGDEVQADVVLEDANHNPAAGSLTFYVVDEGVLMLTGYTTPDPLPAFSASRPLGVFPLESREHLGHIIALRAGEHFDPLGWEIPPSEPTNGGDKGDEVGDGESERVRANFKTTVFFESGHPVGDDGKAQFKFTLPDNLTSFRLMAVAVGKADRFGSGQLTIKSSRPLMARPLLPRILRVGDQLEVGTAVTSLGLPRATASVAMKSTGVSERGPATQQITLESSGQADVRFPVTVTKPGTVTFEFAAAAANARDRVRLTREATQPVRWLNAANFGATTESAAIGLGDLKGVRSDLGGLDVTLSSSALVGLKSVFDELLDYPYGCTEQLASRILPALDAPTLAAQQGLTLPTGRVSWIDEAVGQISQRQRYDGAFGFWDGDESDVPWLSAYALLALERASQSGYFVPRNVLDQGRQALNQRFYSLLSEATEARNQKDKGDIEEAPPNSDGSFFTRNLGPSDIQRLRLAQATFVIDVLASLGDVQKTQLYNLATFHEDMALSSRAQLVHAMARTRLPRQDINPLLNEVLAGTTIGPFEARVDSQDEALEEVFESKVRTTAWVLRAVLAVDSQNPLAVKLARGLVKARQQGAYRNTQEDAWVLLALEEYRQSHESTPPDLGAHVYLGGEEKAEFAFRGLPVHSEEVAVPMKELLAADPRVLQLSSSGKQPLYYAVTLKAAKDGASELAMDEGFSIEKRMRGLDPGEMRAAAEVIPTRPNLRANLGQLVMVDLLLETAEGRDQLVIDDPLPSGLEPVELGFETTAQALSQMNDQNARSLERQLPENARWGKIASLGAVHREMRDDRVLLFLQHINPGIYHLRYLARATTPGHFVLPATRVSCMYDPEIYGQNASTYFDVVRAP
ncbi:MAG TPA: Ig-like domain-containing protein [Polyangiaceae bacterium]|nr:Ig-like domain-containing protein [Polyangiaceae bacterium]